MVELATSAAFRELSPKQFVPLLADKGTYVASESSFYRVLREECLLHHATRRLAHTISCIALLQRIGLPLGIGFIAA